MCANHYFSPKHTKAMKPLTILVAPANAVGHVNACAGALAPFLTRGHRVIFVIDDAFAGKLSSLGFEEHVYSHRLEEQGATEKPQNPGEKLANYLIKHRIIGPYSPKKKAVNMIEFLKLKKFENFANYDRVVKQCIEQYKPDLIYVDGGGVLTPAIGYSGIPWVKNVSPQPLYFCIDPNLPPAGFGLPTNGYRDEWLEHRQIRTESIRSKFINDYIERLGYERYQNDRRYPQTQILTVYGYPEELNYPQIEAKVNWFNLEVFNKPLCSKISLDQLVPEKFLNDTLNGKFSGKLIYFSMGSMGSIDLELMKRLVGILAKTTHKYIVSKGPLHEKFNLEANMYGDRYLEQTSIIPHVDLVITHGGNNTVTETFATGKPMIVLPLFEDQFDNAQRLQETGFGARIDPYNFDDQELIDAIDRLLNDEKLKKRLQEIAKRIQSENRHEELAVKIEQLLGR